MCVMWNPLGIFFNSIYGIQRQKPKDEMLKSQRPHIKVDGAKVKIMKQIKLWY